ncbi:MAG: exodeoxyribonuclease V subunit alpha [Myxococcota bacterium]|nr:exodeoxyribonuclease V subunit alpha [Myxococcota bacterium]
MEVTYEELKSRGIFRDIDVQFTQAICRICNEENELVQLGIALASSQVEEGHICADLAKLSEKPFTITNKEGKETQLEWPSLSSWLEALKASEAVGLQDKSKPLYLDESNRLFVTRNYDAQQALVEAIKTRLDSPENSINEALLSKSLSRLFKLEDKENKSFIPWQALAAIGAVKRNFSVVSGGPGTGKTTTVIRMLALLFEQAKAKGTPFPKVALLAPTGKAASRLEESIRDKISNLECDEDIKEALPKTASTIHRGLKWTSIAGKRFEHNKSNPLPVDVVIVDEASMISLTLMMDLFDATPLNAKLILLGDENQLASVEAGAILGDICNATERGEHSVTFIENATALVGAKLGKGDNSAPVIRDAIVELKDSHRFYDDRGIGQLARAIKDGNSKEVLRILDDPAAKEVNWIKNDKKLDDEVQALIVSGYKSYISEKDPAEQLRRFNEFRVLCAHRKGELGAEKLNEAIAQILGREFGLRIRNKWYPNLPVMVTKNDYSQSLYNGDIGLIGKIQGDSENLVCRFPSSSEEEPTREFTPARLPQNEAVYAMTIHKSQGSEFKRVLVILPKELSPILSRELLYTAVTRAAEEVYIMATEDVIKAAVNQRISRASGLTGALWETP